MREAAQSTLSAINCALFIFGAVALIDDEQVIQMRCGEPRPVSIVHLMIHIPLFLVFIVLPFYPNWSPSRTSVYLGCAVRGSSRKNIWSSDELLAFPSVVGESCHWRGEFWRMSCSAGRTAPQLERPLFQGVGWISIHEQSVGRDNRGIITVSGHFSINAAFCLFAYSFWIEFCRRQATSVCLPLLHVLLVRVHWRPLRCAYVWWR